MHAFGAWLANLAARKGHRGQYARDRLVSNINLFKASNGEEIHGFLWQSLRLLAYDTGTLEGRRNVNPDHKTAVDHAHTVCEPMWWLSPQSMNDCAHAAGLRLVTHGHTSPTVPLGTDRGALTPSGSRPRLLLLLSRRGQGRSRVHGPEPPEPRAWARIWLGRRPEVVRVGWNQLAYLEVALLYRSVPCSSKYALARDFGRHRVEGADCGGISVRASARCRSPSRLPLPLQLHDLNSLCSSRVTVWGENNVYFDRCAAGLGINDAEVRLQKVMTGECEADPHKSADEWELFQLRQSGSGGAKLGHSHDGAACPLAPRVARRGQAQRLLQEGSQEPPSGTRSCIKLLCWFSCRFGPSLQLTCDPASPVTGFTAAMAGCPAAFRIHFPCIKGPPP